MPRVLSARDIDILKKLAPEVSDTLCPGTGHDFHSILPPVSNHFSTSDADFLARIERLTGEELSYLADLILNGEESVGCMQAAHLVLLADQVSREISPEIAESIIACYAEGGPCGQDPGAV